MTSKTINKLPKSVAEVSVTVPWADLQVLWQQAVTQVSAEAELPGFRKGQVPADMLEQRFGPQIQQEFLKNAMPQFLMEALQGTDIVPIDYPQYGGVVFQKGTDLQYKVQLTVRPAVTLGDFKTIKVAKPELKLPTDEDLNKVVDDLFKRWQQRNPQTPTPAPTGDAATGAAGSLNFNGAPATSTVPDDNFAKAVGAESMADLKTKIRADLENEAKYSNELDYEEAILMQVEKMTQVDLPEILIQDELNRMLVSLQRSVSERGMLIDDYLKSQNKTVDSLKQEWRPRAEENVRMELGLAEIARQENVTVTDEELQAEIDKVQDGRLKQQMAAEEPRMQLRHQLRQNKTLTMLKSLVS